MNDSVVENVGEVTDLIKIAIAAKGGYQLSANIENAKLVSDVAFNLTGNDSDNTLTGNARGNSLNGGLGKDTLTGGAGADTFIFDKLPTDNLHADLVTDFAHGIDHIAFNQSIFSSIDFGPGAGPHPVGQFVTGAGLTTAQDTSTHLIYDTSLGNLYYDADANSGGAAILIATFGATNHPQLSASDFQTFS